MSRANRTTDYFLAGLDRGAGFAQQARQNRIQDEELKYVRERRAVTDARDDSEYQYLTGRRAVLDKRTDDRAALEDLYAPELADLNVQRQTLQLEQLQEHVNDMRRAKRKQYLGEAQTRMYDKAVLEFINKPRPTAADGLQGMKADLGADPNFTGPPAVLAGGQMGQTEAQRQEQMRQNAQGIIRRGTSLLMRPTLLDEFYQQHPEAVGKISPGLVELMTTKGQQEAQQDLYQLQLVVDDLIKQGALQYAPDVVDEAERKGLFIDSKHKPYGDRMRDAAQGRERAEFLLDDLGITPEDPRFGKLMSSGTDYVEQFYMRTRETQVQEALQMGVGVAMDGDLAAMMMDPELGIFHDERAAWATQLNLTLNDESSHPEDRLMALNYLHGLGMIRASGDYDAWLMRIENPQAKRKQRAAEESRADAKYFEDEAANLKAQADVIEEQLRDMGWKPGVDPKEGAKGDKERAMVAELGRLREARRRALSDAATSKKSAARGTRRGEPMLLSELETQQTETDTGTAPDEGEKTAEENGGIFRNVAAGIADELGLGPVTRAAKAMFEAMFEDAPADDQAASTEKAATTADVIRAAAMAAMNVNAGAATAADERAIDAMIAKYEEDNGMARGTATDEEVDELTEGLLAIQHAQAKP